MFILCLSVKIFLVQALHFLKLCFWRSGLHFHINTLPKSSAELFNRSYTSSEASIYILGQGDVSTVKTQDLRDAKGKFLPNRDIFSCLLSFMVMLGKIEGKKRMGQQRIKWFDSIPDS